MILYSMLMCWLAVFGVSVTFSTLDGPFGVCAAFRRDMQKFDAAWIRKGVSCPICVSFWAAPLIACFFVPSTLLFHVQLWLSSVGATAALVWLSPPVSDDTHTAA